ncbi:GtrA family protein [Salinibacterium sp. G-O1]|uniref:GtrA family protein n=1 Tax=Salinibacterium sp. G-O1 TaxID=3046208 RepID=UPI0024BADFB6|nr:GtrA family protein [Salinibacterium sp. G-O1]MDJ0336518.1 GtrA family protein [Salinibacterium sp. G-O1]
MADAPHEEATRPTGLVGLIKRLINDQRVRYLIVGGFNTGLGYGWFVVFQLLLGRHIGYFATLYMAYGAATIIAFLLHRHFTFRASGSGNILIDFIRFQGVYVVALAINTIALPILVELAHIPVLLAQALIVILTTLVSYFGHKFFSFRRRNDVAPTTTEV